MTVSVCTVTFSGARASTPSTLARKPSGVSVGSPAIRSALMQSKPTFRASSNASKNRADVWRRPISASTPSERVCGLMLTRRPPPALMARSLSSVTVSGRPGLDGVFPRRGHVEMRRDRVHHAGELVRREGGGGAAAEIDGAQPKPQLPRDLSGGGQLAAQPVHIVGDQLRGLLDRVGDERAVGAPGRAEGHRDIEGKAVGRRPGKQLPLHGGRLHGEGELLPGSPAARP